MYKKICKICGKEFEAKAKTQKYCTAECYGISAYKHRKKYQAEKKAKNQRVCHICKQPLPPFIQKICTDCLLKDFKCNGFSQFTSNRLRGRGYMTKKEIQAEIEKRGI